MLGQPKPKDDSSRRALDTLKKQLDIITMAISLQRAWKARTNVDKAASAFNDAWRQMASFANALPIVQIRCDYLLFMRLEVLAFYVNTILSGVAPGRLVTVSCVYTPCIGDCWVGHGWIRDEPTHANYEWPGFQGFATWVHQWPSPRRRSKRSPPMRTLLPRSSPSWAKRPWLRLSVRRKELPPPPLGWVGTHPFPGHRQARHAAVAKV
jgi:hypothetical protein